MKVTLIAGWPAQTIAVTGQRCIPDGTIEVDDDLGKSLCEQAGKWSKKAAKAATKENDS